MNAISAQDELFAELTKLRQIRDSFLLLPRGKKKGKALDAYRAAGARANAVSQALRKPQV